MDIGDPSQAEQALDDLHVGLDHLLKLVEDRALEAFDDTGLVGFLQGFERLRNRLPLIDHQTINEGAARNLAQSLCQGTMARVLTSTLADLPRGSGQPGPGGGIVECADKHDRATVGAGPAAPGRGAACR